MCGFGGTPNAPAPAPRLPEAAQAPDTGASASGDSDRRRRAAASQTLLTGPRGVMEQAATSNKTLLGQ